MKTPTTRLARGSAVALEEPEGGLELDDRLRLLRACGARAVVFDDDALFVAWDPSLAPLATELGITVRPLSDFFGAAH